MSVNADAKALDERIETATAELFTAQEAQLVAQATVDDIGDAFGELPMFSMSYYQAASEDDAAREELREAEKRTKTAKQQCLNAVASAISFHVNTYNKLRDDLTIAADTSRSTDHLTAAMEHEREAIESLNKQYTILDRLSVY